MSPEVVFILLLVLMIGLAGLLLFDRVRRQAPRMTADDKVLVHVSWHQVEQHIKRGGPTHFRQAVIEGDKLVDHSLRKLGVPGETMGERLRAAQGRFSDYDGVWKAHKLRNQIVHEVDKEVLSFEAKQAIGRLRRALTDLGVL